ncbi:MAG: 4Fe-4S cluster-binding domain-containing protein, partial [Alphaproteobacteria bacterium]|nr:4Fe-4S cluster-binding domain-containing protein [Alphaproteobacteria bacterium]
MNKTARTLNDLVSQGLLSEATPGLNAVAEKYAIGVTPHISALIDPMDSADPIAKQFIPSEKELIELPGEVSDPIADKPHSPVKGIVHRYPDRVLLVLLQTCAAYCRFCFRREHVGHGSGALSDQETLAALDYIRSHKEIWEVIFSGGDPLILSPRRLSEIVTELNNIDHVRIIRFHTRVPIVDPARVTPELIKAI